MAGEYFAIEHTQIEGNERKSLGLEASKNLADQAALDGIGLQQYQSSIRHRREATAGPGHPFRGLCADMGARYR